MSSIQVSLTQEEQQLYLRDSLDLTPATDSDQFVAALRELYEAVLTEGDDSDDEGRD